MQRRAATSVVLAVALGATACGRARDDAPASGTTSASGAPSPRTDPAKRALREVAARPPSCAIAVEVVADGVWVGTESGARRFVARCGHELDIDAASHELQSFLLAMRDDCEPRFDVEVAGVHGTSYYDLLAGMDAARAAGFTRISMTGSTDLAVSFPDAP